MDQVMSFATLEDEHLKQIASALTGGIIVVDAHGQIVWVDERTRRRVNGGLKELKLPLCESDRPAVSCFMCAVPVPINGEHVSLCMIQQTDNLVGAGEQKDRGGHDLISAIEAVLADTSWFTRAIVDKVKAFRQTAPSMGRSSDLDLLTDREREVLGLICEGRGDLEMSEVLNLSQNTVRNHIASLYRKIGVNRRSAAIIWARERGITCQDTFMPRGTRARPQAAEKAERPNRS